MIKTKCLRYSMDSFQKHVLKRLDDLEGELAELREVTWPVCQGIVDEKTGSFSNLHTKGRFFRFLENSEVLKLLNFKAKFMGTPKDVVVEELRQIRVEVPQLVLS